MANKKNANYINKPFMLDLDITKEKELYDWLRQLPVGEFKQKTKKYWMAQMKKEGNRMGQMDEEECSYCKKPMFLCDCEEDEVDPEDYVD